VHTEILLTPGFSPVQSRKTKKTVSTVSCEMKPLKRLGFLYLPRTWLKPGVNEKRQHKFVCAHQSRR